MLKGFWKLTWVETENLRARADGFVRECWRPGHPVSCFWAAYFTARAGGSISAATLERPAIFAAVFIAIGAVTSLTAIISIYREGGILKRLRATPLSPVTILGAHVMVKVMLTIVSLTLLLLAGKRSYPGAFDVNLLSFSVLLAMLLSTVSIVSIGFVIASIVPTARFSQPIASAILFPMLAISGLPSNRLSFLGFANATIDALPSAWQTFAGTLPLTHAVSLLRGMWAGAAWSQHYVDVGALVVNFAICSALSAKVFRWE